MKVIDKQVIELSESIMRNNIKGTKSIFCTMVLRLMDTEEYGCDYCRSLDLVSQLFPEVDIALLEKELDKYV